MREHSDSENADSEGIGKAFSAFPAQREVYSTVCRSGTRFLDI